MNELEQLQRDNKALTLALQTQQEINGYKQFFLARVAHELRSPLSSLMSLQQLILHDLCEDPAEEKAFLKDANVAAHKLLKMIDDLVTVAKIDYGKISLERHPLALKDLFSELEYTIKLPLGNHNFNLKLCAPDSLPLINGDRQKILWVLRNLIDRALTSIADHSGTIILDGSEDSDPSTVVITLQLPCGADLWQFSPTDNQIDDMADALAPNPLANIPQNISLSPPLTWQLTQTLMEKMGSSVAITADHLGANNTNQTTFCFRFAALDPAIANDINS